MTTPIEWVDGSLLPHLRKHHFRYSNEIELQDGVAEVLAQGNCIVEREVTLFAKSERIDFVVKLSGDRFVGIEVKIDGSFSEIARQLHRYANAVTFGALVLITTRSVHDRLPQIIGETPVRVFVVGGFRP